MTEQLNFEKEVKFKKTGTTIVGLIYKDGVILAADTRATSGPIVADKHCFKIHEISSNILACGAGVAADTDRVTRMISKKCKLFELKYNEKPRVFQCVRSARNFLHPRMGHITAALIFGGVDQTGPNLFNVSPHGWYSTQNFLTMGSGSLAAIGILEVGYKLNMEKEEAIKLAVDAVKAGIMNDLYSGSGVDVAILEKDERLICKKEIIRDYAIFGNKECTETIGLYSRESVVIKKEDVYDILEITSEEIL